MASLWDYLNAANDASKAFASGAVTGASQIAGLPGDLAAQVSKGSNALFDRIDSAVGYQHPPTTPAQPYYNIMPTGEGLESMIRQNLTGPPYQPQTSMGHGAQMLGEFTPALMFGNVASNVGNAALKTGGPMTGPILLNTLAGGLGTIPAAHAVSGMSVDAARKKLDEMPDWIKALLTGSYGGVSSAY